jgi:hypothetical protein
MEQQLTAIAATPVNLIDEQIFDIEAWSSEKRRIVMKV